MAEILRVTPQFAVAGQLAPADLARAAAEGYRTVIKNRPEKEEPGQPSDAEMKAAAEAAGLVWRDLPFAGLPPPPGVVAETATLLEEVPGPVLAYCRTGRRSIMAWAMAQALSGNHSPDEIIALAKQAGYDIAGAREALIGLAP
ncbi:TIGR01244 family sulfur transferase [Terricaulis sp.]|uniref:TIGR01244 family sulfur transferase n=1 Tax=Terricaulis sp. TaxID=2768686 RepID=UPI0037845597